MTKKFDNFLLSILWLLTVTLGITFWMNIKYGFNIFSAAHWAYLSELQAYRTQIKIDFYISLIVAIVIGLVGFYLLARPKPQPFSIDQPHVPTPPNTNPTILPQPKQPVVHAPVAQENQRIIAPSVRPMSPMGASSNRPPQPTNAPMLTSQVTPQISVPKQESRYIGEMSNIMENAGYLVKPCAKIGKLIKPVVALSYDQKLWISVADVSTSDVMDAIQTLIAIFDDTLGDSAEDMSVYACVLNPTDESTKSDLISTFRTIDELREFMTEHPNTKPDDYDQDLFDAVSTYIDTVTSYIGKQ